jgi:hypothetical protein
MELNITFEWLALLLHIQKFSDAVLTLEAGYIYRVFVVVLLSPSRKFWDCMRKWTGTTFTFFPFHHSQSPSIQLYIIFAVEEMSLNKLRSTIYQEGCNGSTLFK